HHEELRGAVSDGDPGELDDVRAVDVAERIRRARLLHGRAEAAEYVVHAREIGDLGQAIEAHHALVQLLVCERQLPTGEDRDARVHRVLEQQAQHVTADEPGRSGDESRTGRNGGGGGGGGG